MRATTLDATIASERCNSSPRRRKPWLKIPHAVVFTMTKAVRSKQHSGIAESLAAQGVDLIDPPLMERAAFSALFEFGGNLRSMPAQGNMDGAIENAALFAQAVYKRLAEGV